MCKIKVFHLIKSLERGGAEVLLSEGLRFADRDTFEYEYGYFRADLSVILPALLAQEVEVTCFGGGNNLGILAKAFHVARHLRRREIDVLHCHLPIAGVVGRIAARLAGIPVVYTEHNKLEQYHAVTRWLNKMTYHWQHHVVAVSASVRDSIRTNTHSDVPVEVILNGVDPYCFQGAAAQGPRVRKQFGIPANARVVGTVAAFRPEKKLDDWLDAARLLHERHPFTHFLLVGDGSLRASLLRRIEAYQLGAVVHLAGAQTDVRSYLAAMDIYMSSSLFEGLPIAMLEAMAMERVPVCTAVGGIPEVIRPGHNGFLTEPESPEQLACAVGKLLTDPSLLGPLGTAARRTVEEGFSIQRMVRGLEAIYLGLTERRFSRSERPTPDLQASQAL